MTKFLETFGPGGGGSGGPGGPKPPGNKPRSGGKNAPASKGAGAPKPGFLSRVYNAGKGAIKGGIAGAKKGYNLGVKGK
jgi:hypothetical protein